MKPTTCKVIRFPGLHSSSGWNCLRAPMKPSTLGKVRKTKKYPFDFQDYISLGQVLRQDRAMSRNCVRFREPESIEIRLAAKHDYNSRMRSFPCSSWEARLQADRPYFRTQICGRTRHIPYRALQPKPNPRPLVGNPCNSIPINWINSNEINCALISLTWHSFQFSSESRKSR